jgi:hypothetical protein
MTLSCQKKKGKSVCGLLLLTSFTVLILLRMLCSDAHEREVKNLMEQLREVARQREAALGEVVELKTQLKLVEESRDGFRRDLIDANRCIREGRGFFLFTILLYMHCSDALFSYYLSSPLVHEGWQLNSLE